jgi:hypothetical protein
VKRKLGNIMTTDGRNRVGAGAETPGQGSEALREREARILVVGDGTFLKTPILEHKIVLRKLIDIHISCISEVDD